MKSTALPLLIIAFLSHSACSTSPELPSPDRCPAGELRCTELFTTDGKAPRAGTRLTMDLEDVKVAVRNRPPQSLLPDLASDSVREKLLYIQALAKILAYRDLNPKDAKELTDFFEEIKEVEGIAGKYGRRCALSEQALKGGAPANVVAAIDGKRGDDDRAGLRRLQTLGWSPSPEARIQFLIFKVNQIDFGPRKNEANALHRGVRELAKSERARLLTLGPTINLAFYSEEDLEKGLHTLRRSIRWVIQSMSACEGCFRLTDPLPLKNGEGVNLETNYATSKYVKFREVPGVIPLTVHRRAVLEMAKFVVELGLIKDFKEFELDYATFLTQHGFAPNLHDAMTSAHPVAVRAFGTDIVAENLGHALYQEYLTTDPLKTIEEDLKPEQ